MLGNYYRYQVLNGTGVSVTVTIKDRRWKWASDGSRSDDSESTPLSATSVSAGAYQNASSVDNSSTKWIGAHLAVTMAPGASATGVVEVYLQRSTDGGTTWPANGQGLRIGSLAFAASSSSVIAQMSVG